jgi:hypothetical protein
VSVDPRLTGAAPPAIRPGATDADRAIAQLWAAFGDLKRENAELRRQMADMRAAATIQIGAGSPAGLAARDGAPYGQTNATFWLKLPTGWRGVALPLT